MPGAPVRHQGDAADRRIRRGRIFGQWHQALTRCPLENNHLDDGQVRRALSQCCARLKAGGELFIIDALMPEGKNPVGRALRESDNGAHVRLLRGWKELFATELELRKLRPVSQWPFDYVFLRATGRCATQSSLIERPA